MSDERRLGYPAEWDPYQYGCCPHDLPCDTQTERVSSPVYVSFAKTVCACAMYQYIMTALRVFQHELRPRAGLVAQPIYIDACACAKANSVCGLQRRRLRDEPSDTAGFGCARPVICRELVNSPSDDDEDCVLTNPAPHAVCTRSSLGTVRIERVNNKSTDRPEAIVLGSGSATHARCRETSTWHKE